eukprot:jgi/Psemu1/287810/fgenesh1_pg.215_\
MKFLTTKIPLVTLPRLVPSLLWLLLLAVSSKISNAIQLRTTSSRLVAVPTNGELPGSSSSSSSLQDFISRPINWPEIVLSSNRVMVKRTGKTKDLSSSPSLSFGSIFRSIVPNGESDTILEKRDDNPAFETLRVGDTVEEYFALNQFKVDWTCTRNEMGKLVMKSPDGVPGIASNCVMDFEFENVETVTTSAAATNKPAAVVRLTMEYTPESPLAVLAVPALVVDNWLALNVLLPAAVDARPLDSFRKLMGALYGVAGVAHFLDLTLGGSVLFTTVIGIPSFENLSLLGQLYSLLWCAAGPMAYVLSAAVDRASAPTTDYSELRILGNPADIGIVLYGIVELFGALLSSGIDGASSDVVTNAAGVQAIVLAAWIYSYQKQQQRQIS